LHASVSPDNSHNKGLKSLEDLVDSASKSDDEDGNEDQALVFGSTDEITN